MLHAIGQSVGYLGNPVYWAAVLIAVALAVHGLIPGVGSLTIQALAIPFILFQIKDPAIGLVMLATLGGTNNTLDTIPSVLVGLPGAATQVTFLEGHQLARRGQAAFTMGAIYGISAIGCVIGAVTLAVVIPIIKPFILKFGFAEIAVMALFGVAMVSVLSHGAMIKGLAGGLIGMFLGSVGMETLTGIQRYTFSQDALVTGLPLVATVLGVFALPELIDLTVSRTAVAPEGASVSIREVWRGAGYSLTKKWGLAVRQSLFGVLMGAIPGIGSGVVDWLAYAFGIAWAKDRSQFGKGALDGVLFAEAAQNSKEGGQAIPTLALGVPGGTGWIMVIVGMLAYGIAPGPQMVGQYAYITMLMVYTLAIGNLAVVLIGMVATGPLVRLTRLPYPAIAGVVIPLALVASFINMEDWLAIPIALVMTVLGLFMKAYGWPRPPLVLGFILGPIIEENLFTALSVYGVVGTITRPVTIVMFILVVAFTFGLNRAMRSSSKSVSELTAEGSAGELPAVGGAAPTDSPEMVGPSGAVSRVFSGFTWRRRNFFTLFLIVGFGLAAWQAAGFPSFKAEFFPLAAGIGVMALAAVQLIMDSRSKGGKQGDIMDLALRSAGVAGWRQGALLVLGLFAAFVFISYLFGLQYGAIAFGFLAPMLLLEGRRRWVASVIAGAVVAAFVFGVGDKLMVMIWPQPVLGHMLFGLNN